MTGVDGMRVLVPGTAHSSAELARRLRDAGAIAEVVPLIAVGPPPDPAALTRAVDQLSGGVYQWVGFTSANAVDAVLTAATDLGVAPVAAGTRVASVGAATSAALGRGTVSVDLQPVDAEGAARLAEIWPDPAGAARRVLLPVSDIGLPTLRDALRDKGYEVEVVVAYTTETHDAPVSVRDRARAGGFGAVLLASPSAAAAVAGQLHLPDRTVVGCIGRTTAAAARTAGLAVTFVATAPNADALVRDLVSTVAGKERP